MATGVNSASQPDFVSNYFQSVIGYGAMGMLREHVVSGRWSEAAFCDTALCWLAANVNVDLASYSLPKRVKESIPGSLRAIVSQVTTLALYRVFTQIGQRAALMTTTPFLADPRYAAVMLTITVAQEFFTNVVIYPCALRGTIYEDLRCREALAAAKEVKLLASAVDCLSLGVICPFLLPFSASALALTSVVFLAIGSLALYKVSGALPLKDAE